MDDNSTAGDLQKQAQAHLASYGMMPFGWFKDDDSKPCMLIGNIGSSLWPSFSRSHQFTDGARHPLDRWTEQIISPLAQLLGAEARYPFGETVWPFQQWAIRATGMQQSPLGLLVHPEYGLWLAFRAVLVFEGSFSVRSHLVGWHPCDRCPDKPCLNTCPVGAFSLAGYEVSNCIDHVRSDAGKRCRQGGCMARQACPVGQEYASQQEQQAFHMAAFAGP